jgi:hypothetical protein
MGLAPQPDTDASAHLGHLQRFRGRAVPLLPRLAGQAGLKGGLVHQQGAAPRRSHQASARLRVAAVRQAPPLLVMQHQPKRVCRWKGGAGPGAVIQGHGAWAWAGRSICLGASAMPARHPHLSSV